MCPLPGVCVPFSSQGKCSLGNRQNSELWWKSWDSLFVVLVPLLLFVTRSHGCFLVWSRLLLHRSQGGILPSLTLVIPRSKLWISWHMGIFLGLAATLLAKQPMLSLMAPSHLLEPFQIRWMFRCCFAHQLFSLAWLSQFPAQFVLQLYHFSSSTTLHLLSLLFRTYPVYFCVLAISRMPLPGMCVPFLSIWSSYMSILALFWVEWALMCKIRTDFILYLNIW